MKPTDFFDLPDVLVESFLWDMELDYDSYESSKAEAIHSITCNGPSSTNKLAIKNYWKALSEQDFQKQCHAVIESTKRELESILKLIS